MDSSFFLTIVDAAIGFFVIFRTFRFHKESNEIDSSSSSSSTPSLPPSSLSVSSVSPSSLATQSVPPDASSSFHNWTHDVFPSFRGEDVRINFLSHIQKEFQRKGITPFNDNGIKRGESIGPELIRGIRESKIAIVLLSKNYASSKWCLDELVEIMKCRKDFGQTVMAIFYGVDPSDVKKLAGDFGKVFSKTCEGKSKEVIEEWRQALVKVATIAGYDSSNWDNEAAMIERIATDVSNKLIHSAPSSDFDAFIGMRAHMEKMEPLLRLGSNEVRMIGIWGPSGIGKSTIARVLYSQYSNQFQLSVFMENIKRGYPRPYYDEYGAKLQLQREFLSGIFNQEDIKIHHLGVAPDRLKDKRVLVVLDDVDHLVQLDAMAKETRWFGPGSRIIITTQDKKLLKAHKIEHIYEVDFPSFCEALEIFCGYAFGQKSPYDGFEYLAREVTQLAGRLPLGLRVMGSYFKGMSKHEWTRTLPSLRTSLDGETESILKFSYDALGDEDKALFLYIACFFNDEEIKKLVAYLADKFSDVEGSLRVLAEKSLISIKWAKYINMHTLLARLGREIVRKQSINEPWKRQFLVDDRDICQVLRNDSVASQSVIGINMKYIGLEKELKVSGGAFEKMLNAQFLRLVTRHALVENLNYLPPQLRLLHWRSFPMTCLPSNFNPEFLVEINMCESNLEKLWEGSKMIKNLKWMDLSRSSNLKELPDLSSATNLRNLNLSCCSNLAELPFSIGNMTNLKWLYLNECSSLVELPSSIANISNLKELNLSKCSSLVHLPSSTWNMTNLQKLSLNECSSLVELPSSIGNMTNLKELHLKECSSLTDLPYSIGRMINLRVLSPEGCSSLVELPFSIGNMTEIRNLDLRGCSSLVKLPISIGSMTNLKELNLDGCSSLVELPSSIGNMTNFKDLNLRECSSLVELPSSIGNMTNLKWLYLNKCSSLVELPSSIGNLTNLKGWHLSGCSDLVRIPSSIGNMTKLINLYLDGCSSLVELPFFIGNMTELRILDLRGCSSLVKLPSSIGNMTNFETLYMDGCSSLVELPYSIGNMTNLKELNITKCSSLVELPSSIENMTNFKWLKLYGCSSLVELPSFIGNMTNLKELNLNKCSSLVKLPSSIGDMTNFKDLNLEECSSLVELPSSIGNMTNLKWLFLNKCSSLVELPSSIGNMTNLRWLYLRECSSLVELPSSIGNMTNLGWLYLNKCSNLVELPSSIGNLHNLRTLCLESCSKLKTLPININMKSLNELDLTDCSLLKSFPEISTNIRVLKLKGTAIEEIPPSIRSWSRLDSLCMTYCENLEKSEHAVDHVTELHLSDTRIQEIAPWVKEMSCLHRLLIEGCTKLVSLPQLPDSLEVIDAENCESLESLDCFFNKTKFIELNFVNCFKLNQEARDLIINTSTRRAAFPGEKVPTYFTYRATGSSLSVNLNGFDTQFPTDSRFKACVLLVKKGDVEAGDRNTTSISYDINDERYRRSMYPFSLSLKEHLLIFELGEIVSSTELVFEFNVDHEGWEIKECGVRPPETLAPSELIAAEKTNLIFINTDLKL